MLIYKISPFFRQFFGGSDSGGGGYFLHVKITNSARKILHTRKCYITQKRFVVTFYQNILNTYNCHNNLIFYMLKFRY